MSFPEGFCHRLHRSIGYNTRGNYRPNGLLVSVPMLRTIRKEVEHWEMDGNKWRPNVMFFGMPVKSVGWLSGSDFRLLMEPYRAYGEL